MAFLRADKTPKNLATIAGQGICLRPPRSADYAAWAEVRAASRAHLTPWEPQWARDELTKAAFRRRLRFFEREAREDHGYAFLIFSTSKDALVGGVTFSHVRRGVSQSAMIGYWLGIDHVGQGFMTRALEAVVPFAFSTLKLHRLEAATQPDNRPSIAVLERNAFRQEGRLRQYLKIGGRWQDHLLFARLAEDERLA